jgi:ABC-type multidrug transport system ATPase subunit
MEALCGLLQTVSPTEFRSLGGREFQVKSNLANVAAYAPQDPEGDVTELTLLEEVRLARKTTHRNGMAETAIETWLDSLGVSENQWNFPLSDDVQNRKLASVLAAFARNRPIVLLDEPTLFLDSSGRKTISKAIISHLSRGGAVISATHDSLFRRILFQSQRKIIK